jgi:hypothetical protein
MPTLKHRIQVTETAELTQALAIAEELWPGESKSTLVSKLAELGARSAIETQTLRMLKVQQAQKYVQTHLAGVYQGVSVADLRHMWERDAS